MNARRMRPVALITGGSGFIGTNLADRLLSEGREVLIFDNLSRPGVEANLEWLLDRHPESLTIEVADIRDAGAVAAAVEQADEVYHLAAQVAVTDSLRDPTHDFEINVRGTLNVLEALRGLPHPPPLLYTSTNKVYGALEDVELVVDELRYMPADAAVRERGISERRPLDFHSPYGCSKGAADQYVHDYSRCYGLRTVVFRMSCIYGPHQCGTEDQGWVAHFLRAGRVGDPLTIYGDGLQVRDVLYVDDLIDAFRLAMRASRELAGRVFNMGGGPANTLSLQELLAHMKERNRMSPVEYVSARAGDQRYYVSDTRSFSAATGWSARTSVHTGLERLGGWLGTQYTGRPPASPSLMASSP
jgi:CDP-paratose 2-epimerase